MSWNCQNKSWKHPIFTTSKSRSLLSTFPIATWAPWTQKLVETYRYLAEWWSTRSTRWFWRFWCFLGNILNICINDMCIITSSCNVWTGLIHHPKPSRNGISVFHNTNHFWNLDLTLWSFGRCINWEPRKVFITGLTVCQKRKLGSRPSAIAPGLRIKEKNKSSCQDFCGRKIENGEERWSNQIHLSKIWLRSDIQPDSWKRSTTSSFQRLRTIPFQPHRWVPGGTGPIPPSTSHIAGLSQTTTVSFIAASKKRPNEKVCAVILKELKHEWTHVIHCITTSKHPCRTYGWTCMTFRSHYIDRMQKKRGTIGKIYCRRSHHGRKRLTGQTTDRKKKTNHRWQEFLIQNSPYSGYGANKIVF